ncbi:MAG: TonB family protein, partial [Thermoanaerobaculia bacterium]
TTLFFMLTRIALALALVVSFSAHAQVQQWMKQLDDSSRALEKGEYARALKIDERLITQMTSSLGPGDAATRFFTRAVVHKALALAGLGRNEEAIWYWQVALALDPAFAESDLSAFGKAGEFLAANKQPYELPKTRMSPVEPTTSDVTPPKIIKRANPHFPEGARQFGVEGRLGLEFIIKTDGRVYSPKVKEPLPSPTLTFAALEAVRQWRFEPGKLKGEPVDVIFDLTMNFKLN